MLSAWAVAVTVSVSVELGIRVLGGVYRPAALTFPHGKLLQVPVMLQLTAVFVAPFAVALN